jgi:hypothetical protein
MAALYGIEKLSVGPELNDVGQFEERRSPLPSFLVARHLNDPPLPQTGGVLYPAGGGGATDDLSAKRRLTADIFRSTARIYLHSVMGGRSWRSCSE